VGGIKADRKTRRSRVINKDFRSQRVGAPGSMQICWTREVTCEGAVGTGAQRGA
jgi:hypothetical protein